MVPIYNRSDKIRRLIENLLNQNITDAEFLLLDDGSTDDTVAEIKPFLAKDSRLRLITKHNTGTGDTRNLGIHKARGKWLYFLDSDDAIPSSDTLSKLVELAESEHVLVAGGSTQFERRGKVLFHTSGWPEDGSATQDDWFNKIGDLTQEPFEYFAKEGVYLYTDYQYDAGFSRFIYSKQLLIDNCIAFPRATFYEDPLFFVRAMDSAKKFAVISEPTYIYRIGWHPIRFDYDFCIENLHGMKSNLLFSKKQGYSRLHRITYERFKRFGAVELALSAETYVGLSEIVRATYDAFDPDLGGVDASSEVPASVVAINRFGTPEWNESKVRLERIGRLKSIKIKNAIKCNPLLLALEDFRQ